MCDASRGSTSTEWSIDPSGVFCSGHSAQVSHIALSFQPSTGSQVSPPSAVVNRPCGDPPANHTPGSSACPGVSQNTAESARPSRSPLWNAGGRDASVQVFPRSSDRNTVGPRCPVRMAASSREPSRGSTMTCCAM